MNLDLEQFLIKGEARIPNLSGAKFNHVDLYEYQRALRVSGGKFDIPFGWMSSYLQVWLWVQLVRLAVPITMLRRCT